MGFVNWLNTGTWNTRAETPVPDSSSGTLPPSRTTTPQAVSIGDAVCLASVFRAVQVIGTATTQLSIDAYKGDEQVEIAPSFIRKPNVDESLEVFIEKTTNSLSLNGNAYWRIYRDNQSRVQNLEVLNPLDVTPNVTRSGRVTGYTVTGFEKPLLPNEVKHLQLIRLPGNSKGLGPIQAAQRELRGAIDLRDYASNWFHDSGVPSGILKSDQYISPELADEAQDRWDNQTAGRTRVMGNGLDYKSIYLSPRDAQFLENQAFSTQTIARIFGIPAGLMLAAVDGNSQTYANISQVHAEFVKYTISAYTREIEVAFSDLLPRGTVARFNFEAFLRPDVVTRYDMHAKAISAGWLTPNEVRKIEGYAPIAGGDELKPSKTQEATNANQQLS